jgi:hypothetical protein
VMDALKGGREFVDKGPLGVGGREVRFGGSTIRNMELQLDSAEKSFRDFEKSVKEAKKDPAYASNPKIKALVDKDQEALNKMGRELREARKQVTGLREVY